jgi:hypothetical protein
MFVVFEHLVFMSFFLMRMKLFPIEPELRLFSLLTSTEAENNKCFKH